LPLTSAFPEPGSPPGAPNGAHSYDFGVSSTGVIWITSVPEDAVAVHLGDGTATLDISSASIGEVFTVDNSLAGGIRLPAVIDSLHIEWSGITSKSHHSDSTDKVKGYYLENSAAVEVTATTPPSNGLNGFHFVSDPAATSVSLFALIGEEHNGSFFGG
jgi:hypothetical protein